jgi:hypothetical protein
MKKGLTSGEYAVGYGKPPQETQFKKGQSGNPKGRPKGSLNLTTAVNRALREKITVVENGRRKTITKLDAAIIQMVNRAVQGDARAMAQMLGVTPRESADASAAGSVLDQNENAVLANLLQQFTPLAVAVDSPVPIQAPAAPVARAAGAVPAAAAPRRLVPKPKRKEP